MSSAPMYFCSDEDIANVATSDFAVLTPADQCIARGRDGAFSAPDPWRLTSATTDFIASGIRPGHVVQVSGPKPPFSPRGECFGVNFADSTSVVLKRRGMGAGEGAPPAAAAVANVQWSVLTFGPQIFRATIDLERRFGVSDFILGRRASDMFDVTELADATVYSVLSAVYLDASRGTGVGQPDVWQEKSRRYAVLLADLLSRVEIHWGRGGAGASDPLSPPNRLCGRLSR
jgi:hypothetical protein